MSAAIFRPRVRAAVWLVVGLSAIATVVAIVWGGKLARPVPGPRDSYGGAPLGHRAFFETLEALGMHVMRERRGDFGGVRAPLLFIAPETTEAIVDGERRELGAALAERAEAGLASVVILPKWAWEGFGAASPDPGVEEILAVVLPGAVLGHTGELGAPMASTSASGPVGAYELTVPWLQWVQGGDAMVLLEHEGHALVVQRGDGVIVVTDPDLASNWNVHRADHAALLVDVLRAQGGTDAVAVDEVFHGHGERRSLANALGEHPTILITAQALLVLLLVVWIGSRRFGPARDLSATTHGPAESIAVSAFVLAEGRPVATLSARYVTELVAEVAERLGMPPGKSAVDQAAHVDRIAARRGLAVRATALLERARVMASGAPRSDALALAKDAHALRQRLLGNERT